uniref:Pseudouridylate synthase 1 homolog n=2 Tax=Clastoptera arizonana TaxID=38151 RepID=A0A1B6CAY7_9HEMI
MFKIIPRFKIDCCIRHIVTSKLKMSVLEDHNVVLNDSLKRLHEECSGINQTTKKACLEVDKIRKKKIAMLVVYSGLGYLGLQRNPGRKTIEEELMVSLLKCNLITEEVFNQPQLIQFQRAARTDKGVSAIRQILSMKLPEDANVDNINMNLPPQIRAIAIRRVTKGFNCKSACDARTYSYMLPTFALDLHSNHINVNYKVPEEIIDNVNEVLTAYQGTHNFHNFTSRKLSLDPSAIRYIMSLHCGEPFTINDMEFVVVKIKGQSFMLHQIRKMIGLMISIVRGLAANDIISKAYDLEKLDIPMAPGLGLLLEEIHYDNYNKRYGNDGIHEPLEWSSFENEIEDFKKKYILPTIVDTEKNENSMLSWLETLHNHSFDTSRQNMLNNHIVNEEKEPNVEVKNAVVLTLEKLS